MGPQIQSLDVSPLDADVHGDALTRRLVWGFVALGTIIRLVAYLLRFPLWVDECMLAENFLDKGYRDLLWPLRNGQVAPTGFLWIELAIVRVLGFSEWSLRLLPLVCGIGSLFVFRHVASRLLAGVPLVLAVACLAVAKAPIGLSTNAKPYACDLLAAVVLLALAVEWLRRPERTIWLWCLAAALPVAFAFSFPAVFVAGAVSLGLLKPVWSAGQRRIWCAFAAYQVSLGIALGGVLWICALGQSHDTHSLMQDYWMQQDGFPPLTSWPFLNWLAASHLGDKIFAVPYGAENGAGLLALGLCAAAAVLMYRRGQGPVVTIFLATFGLTFVAALLRIYPYGGHNRLTQFLVPSIAISLGLGTASVLAMLRNAHIRRRLTFTLVGGLALFGAGLCCRDMLHPYHHVHDEHHREFSRRFWPEDPETITICSLTDLRLKFCKLGWYGYYRCNQQIYSRQHRQRETPFELDDNVGRRPLRLVIFRPPGRVLDQQGMSDCLKRFEPNYELAGRENYEPCREDVGFDKYGGYEVFRFKPREQHHCNFGKPCDN